MAKHRESLDYLDPDELEERFWTRPPEEIHRDLHGPVSDQLVQFVYSAAAAAQAELDSIPAPERLVARHLIEPLFTAWKTASPQEREQLIDLQIYFNLSYGRGLRKSVEEFGEHLDQLASVAFSRMPSAERAQARVRWLKIFTPPKLDRRKLKEQRTDPIQVADTYEAVRRFITELRRRPLLRRDGQIDKHFDDIPPPDRAALKQALTGAQGKRTERPITLAARTIVGRRHHLEPSSVGAIVAHGRRLKKKAAEAEARRARIAEGENRYQAWLSQHHSP